MSQNVCLSFSFSQLSAYFGRVRWWVAHVLLVLAQVLLVLTLGLWTLDFGLTMTCSSGLGSRLPGWSTAQSVTVDTTSLTPRGGE